MRAKVEVLAPAGSAESMKAAIQAGADAVYMGGSRFGARAYADNPGKDQFLDAIDYAHLHGRRLYMTVNTLVKEKELPDVYDFLRPYYERGLDAVIVQDLGVFSMVRRMFPDLAVHASTQMTVTGRWFAKELKRLGASRVVTARELSLEELERIHKETDIEIESFVHGALCYCYSGQCLMSSLIGGRSGNRGRCAQPCRLPYGVAGRGGGKEQYVLSLKDLCTLDILPDIIEAGVYSLKIEGRMKSPRYTAGVVSIYRKYVDRYLRHGRRGYRVDPEDKKILLDLFDRGGHTEGYYRQHNGRDMVALKGRPGLREVNQALFDRLDREYVGAMLQEPVAGRLVVHEGEPVSLSLAYGESEPVSVTVAGPVARPAQNQPLTEERLARQMCKTGGAPFYFRDLHCDIAGSSFLSVQELNGLRRQGLRAMEEALLMPYRRGEAFPWHMQTDGGGSGTWDGGPKERQLRLHVSLEEPDGLHEAALHPDVSCVSVDAGGFAPELWKEAADLCHGAGKTCMLALPQVFRKEAENYFLDNFQKLRAAGFDGLLVRSMEEVGFLREHGSRLPLVFDANLYAMNREAVRFMEGQGAARLTLPLELNSRELEELGCQGKELVVYGYLPAMVSAQCVRRTVEGCRRRPGLLYMRDRTGKELPVRCHCRFCFNTIYNPAPLSLLGMGELVGHLAPSVLRLQFTIERPDQVREIITAFAGHFLHGRDVPAPFRDFTRGHMRRGIE